MIKSVIFDMDGTLCDTMDGLQHAMNRMLESFGWQGRTKDELTGFINRGTRVFVGLSMPKGTYSDFNDKSVDAAIDRYCAEYEKCYADMTAEYPGTTEMLKELRSMGLSLGILSNKNDAFVKSIADRQFPKMFEAAAGFLPGRPKKPDCRSADCVTQLLGVQPCECVFIGDSDVDMQTGKNTGMIPVGAGWGYRPPEVLTAAGAVRVAAAPCEICSIIRDLL